jgi:phosphate transport system protein
MRTVEQLPDACLGAGVQMLRATEALVLADDGEARNVIRVHDDLTARTVVAQASTLQLLVRHEGDLAGLSVSLQIIGDLNEMNLLARRVARVALRAYPEHALPEDVTEYFSEMGERAD